MKKIDIGVFSEVGTLDAVIIHSPGSEVENMIPENVERALYSDILNLSVASKEYSQFKKVLQKTTQVFEVRNLLSDILDNERIREGLIDKIFTTENVDENKRYLMGQDSAELSRMLIEGVPMLKNNLTKYIDKNRYSLPPLHNFFFTRDASVSIYNKVLISKTASKVRMRESTIMESIFNYHPAFNAKTVNPVKHITNSPNLVIEGGDVIIANENILILGVGPRTTTQGVDFLINSLCEKKGVYHILVQELPDTPESFIHLDMAFTLLDVDKCMIFEPLIIQSKKYNTYHIEIDDGEVKSIKEAQNLVHALKKLGMDMQVLLCGGKNDIYSQEREQWHSGANFFAIGPGKVIGYERNIYTVEELSKNGFEVVKAKDIISDKVDISKIDKYIITIDGSELSRGGGGARCMTMPVKRQAI